MNFNLGDVLTRAAQITWKHKTLWVAGILISLLGLISIPISMYFGNPATMMNDAREMESQLTSMLLANGLILLISIAAMPIYIVGMTIPSLATKRLETGESRLSLAELVQDSLRYFWRILGVFALLWVGMFAFMIVFMGCIAALMVVTFGMASLCLFPLFLLFIPVAIFVYAYMEQSISAIVVDDMRLGSALDRAWQLVKSNPGGMALLSIVIYIGTMVVSLIISVPMMIPMFGMMSTLNTQPDLEAMNQYFRNITLWTLAFSPLYALLQGVLLTFMQSAWTLTYMRLTKPRDNAPLVVEAHA